MTLPPLNYDISAKNEDIEKLLIWPESHEKELQNVPLSCLDWIKSEQDIKDIIKKCKTSRRFFETLYVATAWAQNDGGSLA